MTEASRQSSPGPVSPPPGSGFELQQRRSRTVALVSLAVGAGTGLVLGLWSFGGPVPVPAWLGEYDDVSRRLARLGHIAFFGLAFTNLLLVRELPRVRLGDAVRRFAAKAMNFGNVFLPLTLFAAAAYHPCKYLMSIPATATFVALAIAAWGALRVESRRD